MHWQWRELRTRKTNSTTFLEQLRCGFRFVANFVRSSCTASACVEAARKRRHRDLRFEMISTAASECTTKRAVLGEGECEWVVFPFSTPETWNNGKTEAFYPRCFHWNFNIDSFSEIRKLFLLFFIRFFFLTIYPQLFWIFYADSTFPLLYSHSQSREDIKTKLFFCYFQFIFKTKYKLIEFPCRHQSGLFVF